MNARTVTPTGGIEFSFPAHLIKAVYSGKHGCACGCRGNHTDSSRSKKHVINKIHQVMTGELAGELDVNLPHYIAAQTDTRLYIAYLDWETAA